MKIPFLNFEAQNTLIRGQILQAFESFFDSKYYVLGNQVKEFEQKYAAYHKVSHCVGVANGLEAIHLALRAIGVGNGDEVVVPSNTYIATVLAVSYAGATPIFVEPELITYNIDFQKIEEKITPKTKAIIPVHLYGQCANMKEIMRIANERHLFVVEDNAQAHGALHHGKISGSFGHINATSFYPSKNLGAFGDAGAITTNSQELAEKVQKLRNYGSSVRYYNDVIGYNSRLDEVQAAFLNVKLNYLDRWNQERNHIAKQYFERLRGVSEITLPQTLEGNTHVYHLLVILAEKRDELAEHLKKNEIATLIHYPIPPHLQKAYQFLNYRKGDFPIAEKLANDCLSLPLYPGLSEKEIDYISENIISFYRS